jgi:hypothetical protein
MERIEAQIKFQSPFGALVSGPSMSGKSTLIHNFLTDPELVFEKVPQRIVYVYSSWQDSFDDLKHIEFVTDLDKVLDEDFFDPGKRNCLVLDDQMEEISSNAKASKLFTKFIHHKNISVFFLVQNLFRQGKSMRDITLNCQYIILFKSNRDVNQIKVLGNQIGEKNLIQAYEKAIKVPYGYLLVDLHPKSNERLKFQTNLFHPHRTVFISR